MGRTKNQFEKLDLTSIRSGDLALVLRYGKAVAENRFKFLGRLLAWLEKAASSPDNGVVLSEGEVSQLQEAIQDYPEGILSELRRRAEVLQESMAGIEEELRTSTFASSEKPNLLREELKAAEEQFNALCRLEEWILLEINKAEVACSGNDSGDFKDDRFLVFLAYQKLEAQLGRRPFRTELEAMEGLNVRKRAISKKVERLKLPIGDARIKMGIEKRLKSLQPELRGQERFDVHVDILRKGFASELIKSPEASRLRMSLLEAPLERLIAVAGEKSLVPLINKMGVGGGAGDDGAASQDVVARLKREAGDLSIRPRTIAGSAGAFSMWQALRALADLWNNLTMWGADLRWLKVGAEADYRLALDCLVLSLTLSEKCGSRPADWLRSVAKQPDSRSLLKSVWMSVVCEEVTPQWFHELELGVEKLMDIFAASDAPAQFSCVDLVRLDKDLAVLIRFLEPYDIALKGKDYGFVAPLSD